MLKESKLRAKTILGLTKLKNRKPTICKDLYCLTLIQRYIKIEEYGFSFFFIFFLILFSFQFIFHFSIFKTLELGLEVICPTVTLVTSDGVVTVLITGLDKRVSSS